MGMLCCVLWWSWAELAFGSLFWLLCVIRKSPETPLCLVEEGTVVVDEPSRQHSQNGYSKLKEAETKGGSITPWNRNKVGVFYLQRDQCHDPLGMEILAGRVHTFSGTRVTWSMHSPGCQFPLPPGWNNPAAPIHWRWATPSPGWAKYLEPVRQEDNPTNWPANALWCC